MQDDPRISLVGHLLRQTSLDELPQLVNVLIGQMSLIGPRPALPLEVAMYDHAARRRLAVKPGMTGLWQVSGRSRLSWEESIGFDLDYVDNWSPSTDAAIAVRTFRAVVSKDGAF
jgi:lipopolysaccharide/colanic/teichoic acid biosynthesis glycosyltransferase